MRASPRLGSQPLNQRVFHQRLHGHGRQDVVLKAFAAADLVFQRSVAHLLKLQVAFHDLHFSAQRDLPAGIDHAPEQRGQVVDAMGSVPPGART